MKRNFSIRAFAEIVIDGATVDLHNCYRPRSIATGLDGASVRVSFHRDERWKSASSLPAELTFTCSGNVQIQFNELVGLRVAIGEDAVEVAYYDVNCGWDQFLDEELASKHDIAGLHFGFASGLVLRLRCDEAQACMA